MITTKQVNIYTVSTITGVKVAAGVIGYILEYCKEGQDAVTLTQFEEVENMTANEAAIEVVLRAVRRLTQACTLSIYADSAYLVAVFTQWIEGWQQNEWRTARKNLVEHKEQLQELLHLLEPHEYTFLQENHTYHGYMLRTANEQLEKMVSCTGATERNKHV